MCTFTVVICLLMNHEHMLVYSLMKHDQTVWWMLILCFLCTENRMLTGHHWASFEAVKIFVYNFGVHCCIQKKCFIFFILLVMGDTGEWEMMLSKCTDSRLFCLICHHGRRLIGFIRLFIEIFGSYIAVCDNGYLLLAFYINFSCFLLESVSVM